MGLRDLALLIIIYGSMPLILRKPFIGVLIWYWLSLMNPHRISWTLMNQPFAEMIVLTWLFGLLIAQNEKKQIPVSPITITLGLFWFWMLITTFFAFYPDLAWRRWDLVWKIMLTTYLAILMLNSKERILALTFVVTFSIGFYGFKGGYFTLITGGVHRVWGPTGSFIADNNEIGLALIMTIPLLFYIRSLVTPKIAKHALLLGVILCFFAILGTQSRGAFVGVIAMGLFLAMKSQNKIAYLFIIFLLAPAGFIFMPEVWHERMSSIDDFESDASAMGRITAWKMAYNLALHEPFGGGFDTFRPSVYLMYLPGAGASGTDAHSIYFEVLGEHGFIGLGLFLCLGIFALLTCGRIIRKTRGDPDMLWMKNLAAMIQVSLVGYAVCGAFLGLAYFDYYYAIIAIVVGMAFVHEQYEKREISVASKPIDAVAPVQLGDPRSSRMPQSFVNLKRMIDRVKMWYKSL